MGNLTISQGVGSEIAVLPRPDRTVEIGGRCAHVDVRDCGGQALGCLTAPGRLVDGLLIGSARVARESFKTVGGDAWYRPGHESEA